MCAISWEGKDLAFHLYRNKMSRLEKSNRLKPGTTISLLSLYWLAFANPVMCRVAFGPYPVFRRTLSGFALPIQLEPHSHSKSHNVLQDTVGAIDEVVRQGVVLAACRSHKPLPELSLSPWPNHELLGLSSLHVESPSSVL